MKQTDYAPRAAALDLHIKPDSIGVEIGVDVGAHAEAILTYCNVKKLYLVDVWEREYYRGYCEGRLFSKGFGNKIEMLQMSSEKAVSQFEDESLDFIFLDQRHEYNVVKNDLVIWWPKLKTNSGVLSLRNYAESNAGLKRAADKFIKEYWITDFKHDKYHSEIIIFK